MVRIINNEKEKPKEPEIKLNEKSKALLQIIGIIIADNPKAIIEILEEYSIELSENPTDKELTEKLLSAIGECNKEFNNDLARVILDCTLESSYDSFDFKSLFNKGGDSGGEESGASSGGGGGGGLWAGIANAVGGIAGSIGSGKRAREEATSKTLQGIYAYKSQLAANEQGKGKNKMYMLIALFVVLGLAVAAMAFFSKKQSQQQPIPLKA
ncbi:MAG: hypothetical protein Q7W45_14650 [Bacteroidota bacterium]|nr:hypothetical protein [Bacteroidota bacterium]MDP3147393.1 hypothetical protein [Bacteroidota bacterium]